MSFQVGPDHFWRAWYIQRRQRRCTSRRSERGPWEHFHDFPRSGKSRIDWFSPGHSFGIFRQPEQTENCPLHGGVSFCLLHDSQRRQGITTEPQWRTKAMVYHGCFNFVVSIHETFFFGLCHVMYLFKIQTGVFILRELRKYFKMIILWRLRSIRLDSFFCLPIFISARKFIVIYQLKYFSHSSL